MKDGNAPQFYNVETGKPVLRLARATEETSHIHQHTMNAQIKLSQADFTRILNDVNGNPRYYLAFYLATEKQARKIGGVKYRGKKYGPGWVFQSYHLQGKVDALNACA